MADRLWSRPSCLHPVVEMRAFLLDPGIQKHRGLNPWRFDTYGTDPFPEICTLNYGSGSCSFLQWLSSFQQKKLHFFKLLLPFTFCIYVYICIQIQQVINKSKNSRNQIFSKFFACWTLREGSGSGNNYGSGPGRPKNLRTWNKAEISYQCSHHTKEVYALEQVEKRKWI
jgi:hypothetical protein